jgi:hypothetical protein
MKRSEEHYPHVTNQYMNCVLTGFFTDPALTVEEGRKDLRKAFLDSRCS